MASKQSTKKSVNYRRFQMHQESETSKVGPCMDCIYFIFDKDRNVTNGRCQIVKGKIDEYYTCDLFVRSTQL